MVKPKKDKKKKGKNKDGKPHIAAALVPTASFSAVPRTPPPPKQKPEYTSGLASGLLSSSMLGRLFAQPPPDDDDFNDVDTSLEDYGNPGYYSLARRASPSPPPSPRDRGKLRTPTIDAEDMVDSDVIEDPMYQVVDRNYEVQLQSTPNQDMYSTPPHDIYAIPVKKSARTYQDEQTSIKRPISSQEEEEYFEEEEIITATQAKVEESGMDLESSLEYLDKLDEERQASGKEEDYRQKDTPRMAALKEQNRSLMQRQEAIETELQTQRKHQDLLQRRLDDTEHHLGDSQSPVHFTNEREQLMDQQLSLTDNTLKSQEELIRTLQGRLRTLEHERVEHHEVNTQLQSEIEAFKRHVHKKEGVDGTDTMMLRRQTQDLKDECDTLKSTVHRLNIELSKMQAKYRPTDKENKNVVGLPSKGPIPSWLLNTKYLAPLFLAYDDKIQEKDDLLKQYEVEMDAFRSRVEDILKENQRLHLRLEQTDISGPISMTEWQQLQEQAKLVLEENQLLMEQLDVQQNKAKDMHSAHVQEIARMSKQIVSLQSEKNDLENDIGEWHQRYNGLKNKHQTMVLESETKLSLPEHQSAINEVKKSLDDVRDCHTREMEDIMTKVQTSQLDKKNLSRQVSDLTAENKQLEIEIKGLQKSYRKSQKKVLVLQNALEVSETQGTSAQEYLASLVKVAEKTAIERDTYAQLVKSQEQDRKKAMNRMVEGNNAVGKMEERLRLYKNKAADKMLQIADKMKTQDDEFTKQRMEYLTEIKHLRSLLKEKDGLIENVATEKKQVEDDLEIMWQAATADNRRMQDTMERTYRKLREHKALEFMFGEDSESRDLLASSDTER